MEDLHKSRFVDFIVEGDANECRIKMQTEQGDLVVFGIKALKIIDNRQAAPMLRPVKKEFSSGNFTFE
ncbi:MAG: hypothetical protein KGH64_01785 [Candidatus Micrarchaeota archaeon]|nr:hypothetical protein [Candidatus Micrarchaeota archaeon]MDE1859186.1 hypothetical protein [Candidatus Micrarchaeota archaeon]